MEERGLCVPEPRPGPPGPQGCPRLGLLGRRPRLQSHLGVAWLLGSAPWAVGGGSTGCPGPGGGRRAPPGPPGPRPLSGECRFLGIPSFGLQNPPSPGVGLWGASWGVASAGSRGPAARAAPWTDGLMRVGRPRPRPGADPATWGLSRTPSQHVPSARVGWALGPAAAGASGWIFGAARVRRSSRCRWLASRGAAAGGMGGTPSGADSSRRERRAASTARVGRPPPPEPALLAAARCSGGGGGPGRLVGPCWPGCGAAPGRGRSQCPSEVAGPQPAQAPVSRPGGQNWAEGLLSPLGAGAGDWPLPGRAASGLRGGPLPGAGTWPGR